MKNVAIIGSTGSIGTQTLEIVRVQEDLNIVALAAGSNIELLEKQAREFSPEVVGIWSEENAARLRECLADTDIRVVAGMDGLIEIAELSSSDILVTAIVGMIGIRPTIAAINAGKDIALANKETLVTAGHIIMLLAAEKNVAILPVDSEHSAIFQSLQGNVHGNVQVEDALKHPNWSMGRKITIDSATMVNKGLEVIEAKWLFDVKPENIQVVVQPQSIIHSMVEYRDGAVIAQLGTPDMKLPIQYALCYPERRYMAGDRLDFWTMNSILLEKPDMNTFKGLKYAYSAIADGGSMPTVFNAANECAVAKFLDRKIRFLDIYRIIEECMASHTVIENPDVSQILDTERWVYDFVESRW